MKYWFTSVIATKQGLFIIENEEKMYKSGFANEKKISITDLQQSRGFLIMGNQEEWEKKTLQSAESTINRK